MLRIFTLKIFRDIVNYRGLFVRLGVTARRVC